MMKSRTDFFQVGGTLGEDSPSYVERPADDQLISALERGELCLVLASRQTGKSSLMVHARTRLKRLGIAAGIVDFQPLGSRREEDSWFRDTVYQIERSLPLGTNTGAWWDDYQRLGATQRFMTFLEDVVLREIEGRVVIFFDEIDSVLPLPFSDDFFTTIRALYNARASNPTLKRITFALLGVATPSEFVKSRTRTPFNVGTEVELKDFDPAALRPFKEVLGESSGPLVERIFYWTSGHPLMVQKLADVAHSWPDGERTCERMDEAVRGGYLDAKIEKDTHLKFIRNYLIEDNKQLRKTLRTYRAVLQDREVPYNDQSPIHSRLKLAGVVRIDDHKLVSRNRIYQNVFDLDWIRTNTPRDLTKMVAYGASAALVLVLVWFLLLQSLFFPKFTKLQRYPWFEKDIHYSEGATRPIGVVVPEGRIVKIALNEQAVAWTTSEGRIAKITMNGDQISWARSSGEQQDRNLFLEFKNMPVGTRPVTLRWYGGLWGENFETKVILVHYPQSSWKPLSNCHEITFTIFLAMIYCCHGERIDQKTI